MFDRNSAQSSLDILYEDRVTLNDGRSNPETVLLQLTSETLVIRRDKLKNDRNSVDFSLEQQSNSLDNRLQKSTNDEEMISDERLIKLHRQPNETLGFSIKGGIDTGMCLESIKIFFILENISYSGLPILISRITKHQLVNMIKVGDAILNINGIDLSLMSHDEALHCLRTSGNEVLLNVKYMKLMAPFLSHQISTNNDMKHHQFSCISSKQYNQGQPNNDEQELLHQLLHCEHSNDVDKTKIENYNHEDDNPVDLISKLNISDSNTNFNTSLIRKSKKQSRRKRMKNYLPVHIPPTNSLTSSQTRSTSSSCSSTVISEFPLFYASITQYICGTDKLRSNSFQLSTLDGSQLGIIICDTILKQQTWIKQINIVIKNLIRLTVDELNQTFLPSDQIHYETWLYERFTIRNNLPEWKTKFFALKGNDVYLFDRPPLTSYDFICCNKIYCIYETLFQIVKTDYLLDDRPYCFTLENNDEYKHYFCLETKQELIEFETNWQRSTYMAVYNVKMKSFGCTYMGKICRLIIDIHQGFSLINNETNLLLWNYKFSQLKSSTDNARTKLYFDFQSDNEKLIKIEIECQHLKTLIYVINSFLTAKLIAVDNCG
ncbi:unnamed protein product [Didymodactylos carnosus]|uniref:PDZ domain-containing protein n=1 Tax=Didymodactylos carnosus TaxID=1234261 RepID=A0A813QJC7_9BILA|nr:unnamed protein product [Didymodactylos carnosus]CAF0881756.1 unnamed protein product [Didymodactylos carnosus]CAF3550341.1 unnamed protein product [Didymodactylos carnosus]CAF3665363.1 unnamed protein product [Didymodactylos carnosus]